MDDEITICTPYACVIPGVDEALSNILRRRAFNCLEHFEKLDESVDDHPTLVAAICMDDCYEFTRQARLN